MAGCEAGQSLTSSCYAHPQHYLDKPIPNSYTKRTKEEIAGHSLGPHKAEIAGEIRPRIHAPACATCSSRRSAPGQLSRDWSTPTFYTLSRIVAKHLPLQASS